MFESVTYENILKRMLNRLPSDIDKREGAISYDVLSSVAVELQNMYIGLDGVLYESFADTASLPYMKRRAAERNIPQEQATSAVLKAVSTPISLDIPIGSRFSLETLNYIVTEKIKDGEYKVQCETLGIEGNTHFGSLIPIDYVDGLETIEIAELLVPGEDAEDVEDLREKYFDSISAQSFGGNIADYIEKAKNVKGVGGVKVTPTWNGGGTVKLTITDSTFGVPSEDLINEVKQEIDPVENQGQGYGTAPIGHTVTIESAEGVSVDITSNITYAENWSWESAGSYVKEAVDKYFAELNKGWDEKNDTALVVRISRLEADILNCCEGIIDVTATTLNGSDKNLFLTKYQIVVRGAINGE